MNLIRAAAASAKQSLSPHLAPRKEVVILHPINVIRHSSSLLFCSTATASTTETLRPHQSNGENENPEPSSLQSPPADWPRPRVIPWQAKVSNSVNLIGHVQSPVLYQTSPDGRFWAYTVIAEDDATISDSPHFRISILFEGDLAHIVACHLKEKDYVHVAGQLTAEAHPLTPSQGQSNVQVLVHNINFVKGSYQSLERKEEISGISQSASGLRLNPWKELIGNPKQWMDFREKKRNGLVKARHPDFKHKDSGRALWLIDAPEWVFHGLGNLEFDVPVNAMTGSEKIELWKNLLEDPEKWWDSRLNKVNDKYPDFKHKETGKGLWLNECPPWAFPGLPPLETGGDIYTC